MHRPKETVLGFLASKKTVYLGITPHRPFTAVRLYAGIAATELTLIVLHQHRHRLCLKIQDVMLLYDATIRKLNLVGVQIHPRVLVNDCS